MDLNHQPSAYESLPMAIEVPLALLTHGDGLASGLCPIQLSRPLGRPISSQPTDITSQAGLLPQYTGCLTESTQVRCE